MSSCSCCGTLTYQARRRYVKSRYLSEHLTNDSGKMGTGSPRSDTNRHKKFKKCVALDSVYQCTGTGNQLQYCSLISLTAHTAQNNLTAHTAHIYLTAHSASLHTQHISTLLHTHSTQQPHCTRSTHQPHCPHITHHPHCTSLL